MLPRTLFNPMQDLLLNAFMRLPGAKRLWETFPLGSFALRMEWGIAARYPMYAYGTFMSALLAKSLNVPRLTAIEFGVAGGRGLVALERHADEITRATGIEIDVVGFDTGEGLPAPTDYRDLAHVWTHGFFKMDRPKLMASLKRARVVLGDVRHSVESWLAENPAPIGFVAFDLDYYSSTISAFRLFDASCDRIMPRVWCYFDNLVGPPFACMNDFVGEFAAIREFNATHTSRKICQIRNLRLGRHLQERWTAQMYAFHDFTHPCYMTNLMSLGVGNSDLPL